MLGKVLAIGILLWFLFGWLVLIFAPFEYWRMASARSWPSREGVVTRSFASPQGSTGKMIWKPVIRGTYRDTGEAFVVTRIRYGNLNFALARTVAERDVAQYPQGAVIRVYHSPADPNELLLEPFASTTPLLVLSYIGGAGLLLPMVLYLFRRRPS